MELSEFDIQYLPRPAIKAQVLGDFVAECTMPLQDVASEAGTVRLPGGEELTTPGGPGNLILEYGVRFGFRASNNEAEYEALIAGMNLPIQTRAQRLKAYCDSQLVVSQFQGTYETRDERMIKYLAKVRCLADKFESFEVVRVPRTENTKADVLSKLAASGYNALGNICMEFLKKSSIENEFVEVMQVDNELCWMDEIIDYLRSGKLPEGKKEAYKVIQRAARFFLDAYPLILVKTITILVTVHSIDMNYELLQKGWKVRAFDISSHAADHDPLEFTPFS
ncbi:uncharacterized protein LOC143888534 [Tasmannia lanceolata]|uniref:uncharacterized protein LOC143888534 n=1 Tax=Tasmannia lanceolata TaxID=3420 RepID=UPI004063B331